MSLNTTFPDTEKDVRKERILKLEPFLKLLKEDCAKARTLADQLLQEGIPATSINSSAYQYIIDLYRKDLEKATEIATHFSEKPYNWHCWLSKPDTTKFKKQPNYI